MLGLAPLIFFMLIASVSAETQRWVHEVGKDTGSEIQTYEFPLPPEAYPLTVMKWVSKVTHDNHWVINQFLDAHGNMHANTKYVNKGSVNGNMWAWNEESQEWIFVQTWSQVLRTISGYNSLFLSSGKQTSRQLGVSRETYQLESRNPLTGEEVTYEYMVIRYSNVKWMTGELLFEHTWEIRRE